ncbi:MAG: hypothetical protein JNM10_11365, partial [Planctomycetia bacterium]|nr:hypothetical protein [Planctomycetia bacterium]
MRAVLAVAVALLCVACSADARKGRVYRGPADGSHEGGAADPAAAGEGAAPGEAVEMDPSEAEAVVAERKA